MRDEFRGNEDFSAIFKYINGDPDKLELDQIPNDDVEGFASLFEEIAVLVQSKVISARLAHYFFGFYVIEMVEN